MPDFYYQIKARDDSKESWSNWAWPPVFSGKVEAKDRAAARVKIDHEYGRKFPLRVLRKDLEEHNFLLHLTEIKDGDKRTAGLFEILQCKHCDGGFRIIDKYNDPHESDKGSEFCGRACRVQYEREHTIDRDPFFSGKEPPVIYRIFNLETGMSYIGKTTQVFTLRWYQHFYQGGNCKFHKAIHESKLSDWVFSILEVVDVPDGEDETRHVSEREAFWIDEFDAIESGYNTATVMATQ